MDKILEILMMLDKVLMVSMIYKKKKMEILNKKIIKLKQLKHIKLKIAKDD
jgi:hypothetical protein